MELGANQMSGGLHANGATADEEGDTHGAAAGPAQLAGAQPDAAYFEGVPQTFPLSAALREASPELEKRWWRGLTRLIVEGLHGQRFEALRAVVESETARRQVLGVARGTSVLPACGKYVNGSSAEVCAVVKDVVALVIETQVRALAKDGVQCPSCVPLVLSCVSVLTCFLFVCSPTHSSPCQRPIVCLLCSCTA